MQHAQRAQQTDSIEEVDGIHSLVEIIRRPVLSHRYNSHDLKDAFSEEYLLALPDVFRPQDNEVHDEVTQEIQVSAGSKHTPP